MIRLSASDVTRIETMMDRLLSPAAHRSLPDEERLAAKKSVTALLSPLMAEVAGSPNACSSGFGRLQEAFDAVLDGVATFTLEGLLLYRNPALTDLLSRTERMQLLDAMSALVGALRARHESLSFGERDEGSVPVARQLQWDDGPVHLRGCILPRDDGRKDPLAIVTVARLSARREVHHAFGEARKRFNLTERELQVTALLARRMSNVEIALKLGLSEHTARHYTERILRKLGAASRTEVAKLLGSGSMRDFL